MNIADVLRELRAALSESRFDGLAAVYLFGSVARGDGGPRSDVDIALLYGETAPPARLREPRAALEGELEARLGRPVEAIVLDRAPVDLVHRVMRDSILVVEPDPVARVRFEIAARREFLDLQPILRQYRATRSSPA